MTHLAQRVYSSPDGAAPFRVGPLERVLCLCLVGVMGDRVGPIGITEES